MGYNEAGQGEVYKTQAVRLLQDYGYEPSPAPIKIIVLVLIFLRSKSIQNVMKMEALKTKTLS